MDQPGIHPSLLPATSPITIFPPHPDTPQDEQLWLVGFLSRDGKQVPLGRVAWFGDLEAGGEFVTDDGMHGCTLEEQAIPPERIREFVVAASAPRRILMVDASLQSVGSIATLVEGRCFRAVSINQKHDAKTTAYCIADRVREHDVDEVHMTLAGRGEALVDALKAEGVNVVVVPEVTRKRCSGILVAPPELPEVG